MANGERKRQNVKTSKSQKPKAENQNPKAETDS